MSCSCWIRAAAATADTPSPLTPGRTRDRARRGRRIPTPRSPAVSVGTATHSWGPDLWKIIHTLTVLDASEGRLGAEWPVLVATLEAEYPCETCGVLFREWITGRPDVAVPQDWFLDLHNWINERLGRSRDPWTMADVVSTYGGGFDRTLTLMNMEVRMDELEDYVSEAVLEQLLVMIQMCLG